MKIVLLVLAVVLIQSCSNLQNIIDPGKIHRESELARQKAYEEGRPEREKRAAEKKIADEKKALEEKEFLEKISLRNTINLKIGLSEGSVEKIMFLPQSVSANGKEVSWHYVLIKWAEKDAPQVPFKVVFKNGRVSRFGVDQEQIERSRANVVIQKELAKEEKKED